MTTLPYPSPTDSGEYAGDLLAALGDPRSKSNVDFMSAWVQSESPTFPGYNGLGTSLQLSSADHWIASGSGGQEGYGSLAEGLTAAVDMIQGGNGQQALAPQLAHDLRGGSAPATTLVDDLYESDWGGSGPGGGSSATDARAVASKLGDSSFSPAGAKATTTGFDWTDPLKWFAPGLSLGATAVTNPSEFTPSGLAERAASDLAKGLTTSLGRLIAPALGLMAGLGLVVLGAHQAAAARGLHPGKDAAEAAGAAVAA